MHSVPRVPAGSYRLHGDRLYARLRSLAVREMRRPSVFCRMQTTFSFVVVAFVYFIWQAGLADDSEKLRRISTMKFARVNLQQLCVIPAGIPAPTSDDSPLFTHALGVRGGISGSRL